MDHLEAGFGDDPVAMKLHVAERRNLPALYCLPRFRCPAKLQGFSWQHGTLYASVLRMSRCFSPSFECALKPSLSNMATVPNQRDQVPPALEVVGYASTIPPPCSCIESSAAPSATPATPFFLKSLSTKKHVRRQSFRR